MPEDISPELERFRQQWKEEVTARVKGAPIKQLTHQRSPVRRKSSARPETNIGAPAPAPKTHETGSDEEDEHIEGRALDNLGDKGAAADLQPSKEPAQEPQSALEHYEKGVEKETQGNLAESLNHYRKAYRLDDRVDQIYKKKHFPPASFPSKPQNPNPSGAAVTVTNPAHHSLHGPPLSNTSDLINSFASSLILGTQPLIERSPHPACPIATLPSEVLIEILRQTAILDVASFARLAQVCKYLAFLVTAEDQIWKRICLGPERGFVAMHYTFVCTISGGPLPKAYSLHPIPSEPSPLDDLSTALTALTVSSNPALNPHPDIPLFLNSLYPTYKQMLHHRPRIRFNGCYISTVNYTRPGASSPTHITWNTPVHIVTYYRYLRFFRDGTVISLLTTAEPVDTVPYLLPEHLHTHHSSTLPSTVMKNALRGRWRLSHPPPHSPPTPNLPDDERRDRGGDDEAEAEGTLYIETLGPTSSSTTSSTSSVASTVGSGMDMNLGADAHHKYTYSMQLSLRHASAKGGAAKNTKLVWRGFWSYNRLTDDWAAFGLRNDRPFFWSRVRRWEGA